MAAFNFPASPSNGDNYTLNGVTYQYDGTKWVRFSSSVGAQGAAGSTGPSGPTGAQGAQGLQGAQAHISTSAPSSGVSNGDLWWDSDGGDLSIYYNDGSSAQWVDINTGPRGAQGGTGPTGAQGAAGAQGATGAAGSNATISNNADNRVITGGSGTNLNGESGLTYNGTRLDVTTGDLQVIGGEGGNAELRIVADQGDDGADYWRFQSAASDNKLNIATYASGSWVDKVSITSTGNISISNDLDVDGHTNLDNVSIAGVTTFTGEVSITGQNLTLQGGHPNLYLTDTDHDSDFVISNSNSSFVIKDIQNNVNRIKIFTAGNTEIVGDLDIGDSIRHIGDTDTKIRFPAADTITAETGGSERLRIASDGTVIFTNKLTNSSSYTTHNANFYGGNTNTGGVRIEVAHNNTTVSGNTAQGSFPHHLNLTNYSGSGSADNRMVTIGFDIPTTSTHANGAIAYQATGAGQGDFSFWTETGNAIYERLRITSGGQVLPGADDAQNLGSSTKRWANIYAADMHFSNKGQTNDVDGTWGDWTLQEGEDSIYMINNRTGKKYSITMKEVN